VLDDMFQRKLNASGRFQLIPIPPDLDDAIAGAPIANCNGCERDFALRIGADLAAWGTVQKVSNLILNILCYRLAGHLIALSHWRGDTFGPAPYSASILNKVLCRCSDRPAATESVGPDGPRGLLG
jgi:hypothetical protein